MPKLFYNGRIYTMDRNRPIADNILVEDGLITDINVAETMDHYNKIDLEDKTLIPGLSDSHLHTLMYGKELDMLDLSDVKSIDHMIAETRSYIESKQLEPDDWVFGWGWNQENFDQDKLPTTNDLDKISKNHPIVLKRECRHLLVANSIALNMAGITARTEVEDGKIVLDENNKPNGVICENAQKLIANAAPKTTVSELKKYIIKAAEKFKEYGLTFVQTDDLDDTNISYKKVLQAYYELADAGQLPIRFNLQLRLKNEDQFKEFLNEHQPGKYNEFLTLGPLKIWADGSLGAKTAALRENYLGHKDSFGELLFSREKMKKMAELAYQNDMQIACHAIGDRTIEQFVEIIEELNQKYNKELRHRIIHAQMADYELLERMSAAGINTDIQPAFTASDWKSVAKKIGKAREQQSYLWKDMIDLNINTAGSSDCPIEIPDPIWGIFCAVTRKDKNLEPEFGWLPNQKITVQDALEMYTTNAAFNAFSESKRGKIKVGYQADFSILDKDPFLIEADKLYEIDIKNIVVAGTIKETKE